MAAVRIRYRTVEIGAVDLHVRSLRDAQQFDDVGGAAERVGIGSAAWPMFGVIWASGRVLAQLMEKRDVQGLRILEVGCGLGLASLVLHHREADVTATDHHPEAGDFLARNAALNGDEELPYERADWVDLHDTLGAFDLIIGSDLLYEPDHAHDLAGFIGRHARPTCEVVLVDPGRGNQARFTRAMEALGFSADARVQADDLPDEVYRGQILVFRRGEA